HMSQLSTTHFFIISTYSHHHILHSFPTRRSSDLNLSLPKYGLVKFTWGNVSQITEDRKYIVIKPSGVDYETMKVSDMVVVDMDRSEEHTSELQSRFDLVCRLLLEKKKKKL